MPLLCLNVSTCPFNMQTRLNMLETVKRVHWLRARAQFHRWQEEIILVSHEMEWTVRYFLHHSDRWSSASRDALTMDRHLAAGVIAYCNRKGSSFMDMACAADASFTHCSPVYRSPLPD